MFETDHAQLRPATPSLFSVFKKLGAAGVVLGGLIPLAAACSHHFEPAAPVAAVRPALPKPAAPVLAFLAP